ncbi:FAS1 domain-containing protein [Coprinellus micaceus]|uniref:FAS1 domain-containing protein n=1 Tax=Coprinellus micaceus TaxID=71717 RepID=A0A4Y7TEU5_COPMI|nr:FAS1 domain-containing protein [Coprinellus micaceus]
MYFSAARLSLALSLVSGLPSLKAQQNGGNDTIQSANPPLPNDTDTLSSYLSYHYVYGNAIAANSSRTGGGGGGGGGSSSMQSQSSSTQSSSASQSSSQSGGGGGSATTQSSSSPTASAYRLGKLRRTELVCGNGTDFIGRTLLNDTDYVNLEGNKSQVLAWTNNQGQLQILNQPMNVTVGNSTQFRNLQVANIDQVLVPPGNISTALTATQLPYGTDGGGNASSLQVLNNIQGFTLFAPSADAFTSEFNTTLQSLQSNQSAVTTLLQNHFVNGSTIYSPTLIQQAQNASSGGGGNGTVISAAGEPFTVSQNDTGLFVSNGNGSSAQILRPDVLVQNGVIHLIDQFLINEASSPSAASSAFASASSAATETASDTAILGGGGAFTGSASQTSSGSGGAGGGGASSTSTEQSSTSSSSESQTTSSQTTSAGGSAASGFRFARAMNKL